MQYLQDKKVLVTGASGFVGHAVIALLKERCCRDILTPSINDYNLCVERDVANLFASAKPDTVIHLAGRVGGIAANKARPAQFFYDNIMMGTLVMEYARRSGVHKVVALAAGCGYPQELPAPFSEQVFWSGLPDMNSVGYSMAKKMLIIQSWTYRQQYGFNSVILLPANLYGPYDNFGLETSHVVPALVRKFVEATLNNEPEVVVWGTGNASREFLYVGDAAQVIVDVAERIDESGPFNLGTGVETTVKDLVVMLTEATGYTGRVVWDASRPDGQRRRYYDMRLLKSVLGYVPNTQIADGIAQTVDWYKEHRAEIIARDDDEMRA